MASHLVSLLRDLAPPVAWRAAGALWRRLGPPPPPPTDPFAIRVSNPGQVEFAGAGRFDTRATSVTDAEVVQQVFVRREYSFTGLARGDEIARLAESLADPLILDCGANIGAASVWFAETFPRARVLAIEPEAGNFEILRRNSSSRPRITPILAAVTGRPGEVGLVDPGIGEWGYRTAVVPPGEGHRRVRARTVGELVETHGGSPFVLKLDVEGAEAGIFEAADEALDRFPVIVIELHDWMLPGTASSGSFISWHAGRNRDLVVRGENLVSIANPASAADREVPPLLSPDGLVARAPDPG
jgi:FkbM family methyltransferase